MSISGAFSSLGLNERPNPYQPCYPGMRKYSKTCSNNTVIDMSMSRSTVSLPNMVFSDRRHKFVRNEELSTEQPIDFSKKFTESPQNTDTFKKVVKNYNKSFTKYAETDLDQPTDYSLRYAEDASDSDRRNKITKTETKEFVQDTIKTYCTEDTPYETPLNFSTSTSMSDLRIDEKPLDMKLEHPVKETTVLTPKETTTVDETKLKSEFSSGLMSPEKPVNYCEEGTPGYFSRVASCGSLNSIPVNDPPKQVKEENLGAMKKEFRRPHKLPTEVKAVKFEDVVNYAAETPLMFSRTSSLASLDSIEQHSIHDDRSSVVSDFSRLTSGVISPSELPDSPSQTVPPSPKSRKTVIVFATNSNQEDEEVPKPIGITIPPKSNVFEDSVQKFKIESTPLQFSSGTSLSSLIVIDDDDDEDEVDGKITEDPKKEELITLDLTLSDTSDDEDILAACINMGMQSIRCSESKVQSPSLNGVPATYNISQNLENHSLNLPQLSPTIPPIKSMESIRKEDVTSDSLRTYCTEGTPAVLSHAGSNSDLSILSMHLNEQNNLRKESFEIDKCDINDSKIVVTDFRNGHEEAPVAEIDVVENLNNSPTREANSGRSSLSIDDDSDESEEALLEECILAGMPTSPPKLPVLTNADVPPKIENSKESSESDLSDEEDCQILEDCIKIGIENNRYTTQRKLNAYISMTSHEYTTSRNSIRPKFSSINAVINNRFINNYYTDDTQSHGDSTYYIAPQGSGNFFDLQSDDDLDEIDVFGTRKKDKEKIGSTQNGGHEKETDGLQDKIPLNLAETSSNEDNASFSGSDSSYEAGQALLQQCIQAGMPKRQKNNFQEESSELTLADKSLLQKCILEGMKKCRTSAAPKRTAEEDTSDLTETEEALLRQCIVSGMPKNKNLAIGGPSANRESTELSESERLLLQQCILAGMPKHRNKMLKDSTGSRLKKSKDSERTCCVHCPRYNRARQNGHVKARRKHRDRAGTQGRDTRDVNIVYVTNQVLTVTQEVVDRTRDNWV